MQRTISIKLKTSQSQSELLQELRDCFVATCNQIVPVAVEHRCWNRVALHNFCYSRVRDSSPLGSQMVCNAIFAVAKAYRNRCIAKDTIVPTIRFHKHRSVHFDKRTYSLKGEILSLYTLKGRIRIPMKVGVFQ